MLERASEPAANFQKYSAYYDLLYRDNDYGPVTYHMECRDRRYGDIVRFNEEHLMRYLFPTEVALLARGCEMHLMKAEEFYTGRPLSSFTWGVAYLLQK